VELTDVFTEVCSGDFGRFEGDVDVTWELLHTGTQFLALRWNIGRLLSASTADTMLMPRPRPLRAPYRALLLADPCGDLDAAYEEGMQLHGLLDGQLYLDVTLKSSEIARAYLRENIREFDILHFAGHAELGGQGEGWLLSDGRFTTEDIARMAGGKPFPSLIFANACGSGRGGRSRLDGANAAMTLARTFISAGTRHFIGAHWDVPDTIASTFAHHFYRGMSQGLPVGRAMRQARLALSVAYGEGTILWGSYCLYGDPGTVYFPEANGIERTTADQFALPIVDDIPQDTARGIYHTIDLPVGELLADSSSDTVQLGPYPEVRSESVTAIGPSRVTAAVADMKRALLAVCALAGVLILAMLGFEAIDLAQEAFITPTSTTLAVTSTAAISHPSAAAHQPTPPSNSAAHTPTVAAVTNATSPASTAAVTPPAPAHAPPQLTLDVTAQTQTPKGQRTTIDVQPNTRLHNGDSLQLHVSSDRDVYIALILLDQVHKAQLLFPHPMATATTSNYIQADQPVTLPGSKLWYNLDTSPGQETLLLVASTEPIDNIASITQDLRRVMQRTTRGAGRSAGGVVIRGHDGASPTHSRRLQARRVAVGLDPSQYLQEVQETLDAHGIDVAKAVTYTHLR
ncbi:MAG: CHAT domain-containing protein, partial [Myxococcota bacterium]